MSFALTLDQQEYVDRVRELARTELAAADRRDDEHGHVDRKLLGHLGHLGLLGLLRGLFGGEPDEAPRDAAAMQLCLLRETLALMLGTGRPSVSTLSATQPEELIPTRGSQPRALIVTLYGLYAREAGGWLSVRALIRLLAEVEVEVDVDAQAVRSAISRLERRGMVVADKADGLAGYALSEHAREVLLEGDRRIFQRPHAHRDDHWLMAVFSVPESEREKRHQLRSRLSWLGFGTVSSGVWIAPVHVEEEARDALNRTGLGEYVNLFRAEHVGFRQLSEQVAEWWDLDDLELKYAEFVASYRRVRDSWRRRKEDDAAAFADYLQLLTSWRRLPYLDPGLATELLPEGWCRAEAAEIFFELHERLAPAAHRHVAAVTDIGSTTS